MKETIGKCQGILICSNSERFVVSELIIVF
jgi:hypothetical protein